MVASTCNKIKLSLVQGSSCFLFCASNLFTHSVFPDTVAPETIIVKGVLNIIDSGRQDLDFLTFLVGILVA